MNSVCIIGNLTRDPERKETSLEDTVVQMRIAHNERNHTSYFDITVYGKTADSCLKWLNVGRPIAVRGRLKHSEWKTPSGIRRSKVEIIAGEVDFLHSAPKAEGEKPQAEAPEADAASVDDTAPKSNRRKAKDEEPVAA